MSRDSSSYRILDERSCKCRLLFNNVNIVLLKNKVVSAQKFDLIRILVEQFSPHDPWPRPCEQRTSLINVECTPVKLAMFGVQVESISACKLSA